MAILIISREMDVIKYRSIILSAVLVLVSFAAHAQARADKLKKRVTIYRNETRVDSFLNLLARQTGVGFSFNSKKISPAKLIPIQKGSYTLEECLMKIQQASGIHYALMNNHIILVDNPPQEKYRLQLEKKEKPVKVTKPVVKKTTPVAPRVAKVDAVVIPKDTMQPVQEIVQPADTPVVFNQTNTPVKTDSTLTVQRAGFTLFGFGRRKDSTVTRPRKDTVQKQAKAVKERPAPSSKSGSQKFRIKNDSERPSTSILTGISLLRPDIFNMVGVGVNIQREKYISPKWSWTLSAGFNYIFGGYKQYSYMTDTFGVPLKDTNQKDFAQIPLLVGVQYYVVYPFYAAFETGYTVKASSDVTSYITFSPSVGVKIPVGNSTMDVNFRYLYMNGWPTYPENTRLNKGNFGFWCLRFSYAF